jgi:hypothetical protein
VIRKFRTRSDEQFPSLRQAAILLGWGTLLAIGGCFGYLQGAIEVTHPGLIPFVLGAVFLVGLIAFLIGCGFLLVAGIRWMVK